MQAFDSFAGDSSERTWLLGIAAHKITDHFRRLRRDSRADPAAPTDTDDGGDALREMFTAKGRWAKIPRAWGTSADAAAENTELLSALRRCIDALPPSLAETVWLRDILGVSTQEVCKATGMTPTNLWTRAHRARAALRRCVENAVNAVAARPGGPT
jgi:RNA polymerase sigma-70 factor (ECF subfamily)